MYMVILISFLTLGFFINYAPKSSMVIDRAHTVSFKAPPNPHRHRTHREAIAVPTRLRQSKAVDNPALARKQRHARPNPDNTAESQRGANVDDYRRNRDVIVLPETGFLGILM
ncbi:hypothetical protein BJX99DRAFT_257235 [Aspergillus californicus]